LDLSELQIVVEVSDFNVSLAADRHIA